MKEEEWDKMIDEEKAKWMTEKGIDIATEVLRIPFQVLQKVINYQYVFVISKFPKEVPSNEEPPRKLGKGGEIIPIDEYLGLYEPKKMKITIFNKGIENAGNIIKCNPHHLRYIVKLHEYSHALIHIGFSEDDRLRILKDENYWDEQFSRTTQIYISIEDRLHEHLAQLLTHHSLILIREDARYDEAKEALNRMIETFFELNKHQPPEYRVDNYLEVPKHRIIESISLLKKGWLKGVFDAWSTIIKW